MRRYLVLAATVGLSFLIVGNASAVGKKSSMKKSAPTESQSAKAAAGLMVADFNSGAFSTNLGGKFGAWDKDPNDETQGCKVEFVAPGRDGKGQCLKVKYDVDSPNPAYNGFWLKLNDLDLSKYNKVSFWIKGDAKAGYTTKFKIELKDTTGASPYYATNVTDSWEAVEIPLTDFALLKDKTKMQEFVIVFEDNQATKKAGVIYLDDISFVK